ncbi:MAG: ROK family protein [Cyclobacteriaceae bacterium]
MIEPKENLWGIDLGGTKMEGVVLQSSVNPEVLVRKRIATESSKGYDHVKHQIKELVTQLADDIGYLPTSIGIGAPGILDPANQLMKNCNSTCLNGMPLQADLVALLGMHVHMANDANCFALAEMNLGAVKVEAPDAKVVFGVIMGTGVGGGLVINGALHEGLHGIGGEWGHNFLDASGGPCYCGKVGCVETVLSGPALESHYEVLSGKRLNLEEINRAHIDGMDQHASATIHRLTSNFGKALSVVLNIVDPDIVVIGGGVGNVEAIYTEGVEVLKEYIFNDSLKTKVLKPKLGDSAGVFGAAFLSKQG